MKALTPPNSEGNSSKSEGLPAAPCVVRNTPSPSERASVRASSDSASTSLTELDLDFLLPPSTKQPSVVLDVDKKTPDHHVPRDPRLIRLTGVHPFNVEAPLSALFNEGFLTSPELFYVRNHGAVPQVADETMLDWQLSVEGLVEQPMTLSLRDLMSDFDNVTYPVTLVCAGNRRKEQNQVRKSQGFSWGPAGVSTALFTGVVMSDVLKKACPLRSAKYVCMEGADKLPNGFYGTSVKVSWVMDQERGIMLAHGMNGEPLRPDHGKPLRAVIPGQIGGRSVKWLTKLILTDSPSDNWYHIYDNRVLPTMVSPDMTAKNPKWWMDERYAIYDLNTNSAIAYPAHEEQLSLVDGPESYTVKGYAYAGGGRRISRVELSLNKGTTWILADIEYTEDRYRGVNQDLFGGKLDMSRDTCLCWCFWSLSVLVKDFASAQDIMVRAMDEGMCVQPRDMYWNVLGMMNNPWFRATISREGDYLRFEHPTQPALMPGGWMEKVKKTGGNLTDGFWGEGKLLGDQTATTEAVVEEVRMVKKDLKREITIDELRKHDGDDQPWFVVNGEAYDGSRFLKEHPGGAQSIISAAATDATDEFMAIHSETAKAMMVNYHIGTLDLKAMEVLNAADVTPSNSSESRSTFLQRKSWSTAILHTKREVSWDTRVFRFKLDHPKQDTGLPVGQHLMIRLRDPVTQDAIIRPYTPISETTEKGYMDVLVKIYFANSTTKGGKMSTAMDALPIGHGVDFKGPIGKFEYLGKGRYNLNGDERTVKSLTMICAGSGVTPIYQVFRAVMRDPDDYTQCVVLDGNRLPEDILCKAELDELVTIGTGRGTVHYTLTKPDEKWEGLKGRIDGELVKSHCTRSSETLALICGPEAMENAVRKYLKEDGWCDEQMVFF